MFENISQKNIGSETSPIRKVTGAYKNLSTFEMRSVVNRRFVCLLLLEFFVCFLVK